MLRFCLGPSGSGKSTRVFQEVIDRSIEEKNTNFYIIVPDQFTMQTQMDVVKMHPAHGIMNIDVLSFGRLSHRIFDETGESRVPVLDDMGKSLILRHVAGLHKDELPVIGGSMHRAGYIDEVKSTISELMQYDVAPDGMIPLLDCSSKRGNLHAKLKDIQLLYSEFMSFINQKYVTSEETLHMLCDRLQNSKLIAGSVIVFDGFTGFTPVQYQVIEELLKLSKEVLITLDIDDIKSPYAMEKGEQNLFLISRKTINDIERLAWNAEKTRNDIITPDFNEWKSYRDAHSSDIVMDDSSVSRFMNCPEIAFLEKNLFRYTKNAYENETQRIQIYGVSNVREEVRQTCIRIEQLLRTSESDLFYRDIAIVCGNLDSYADEFELASQHFDIPIYVDKTNNIRLNPFTEYIASALDVVKSRYSYETVFRFLRCGMAQFDDDDIDILENYVRGLGIRGRKAWENPFTRHIPGRRKPTSEEELIAETRILERLNEIRKKVSDSLKPLFDAGQSAKNMTRALYGFVASSGAAKRLEELSDSFDKRGDKLRAGEFRQIYSKVMDLFDSIVSLLGDESVELQDYIDIVKSGFDEIQVGTIPQNVDRIVIGDIERTRLSNVKYLFFVGVNDNAIPKRTGTGGIISDLDRQFLADSDTGVNLAPTPREQMYIQRLYLYMNLTKPSSGLYMSFSLTGSDGKSLRPAYLISVMTKMFPKVKISYPENDSLEEQLLSKKDAIIYVADQIRDYADGFMNEEKTRRFMSLYEIFNSGNDEMNNEIKRLTDAAFCSYSNKPLSEAVSAALYGSLLENSVSRLEQFASCCYAHFIKYGLQLDERDEYSFEVQDLGTVFHGILEQFSLRLSEAGLDWSSFDEEQSERILRTILEDYADNYGDTILMSSARNRYAVERIHRIMSRTIKTLQYQLGKGAFRPENVEFDFKKAGDIDEINIALSEDEKHQITQKMKLHGRIDRIDIAAVDNEIYVKVIDFKSGTRDFSLASMYYGLQLQLVIYMEVASANERKDNPSKEIIPAALLYYRVDDPVIESSKAMSPDEIGGKIRDKLRMTGIVNSDEKVVNLLDNAFDKKSDVIPITRKADGSFAASSKIFDNNEYKLITGYVNEQMTKFGRRIMHGDIEVNPYEMGNKNSCAYCSYRSICGFDASVNGYKVRELKNLGDSDVLDLIKNNATPNTETLQ